MTFTFSREVLKDDGFADLLANSIGGHFRMGNTMRHLGRLDRLLNAEMCAGNRDNVANTSSRSLANDTKLRLKLSQPVRHDESF